MRQNESGEIEAIQDRSVCYRISKFFNQIPDWLGAPKFRCKFKYGFFHQEGEMNKCCDHEIKRKKYSQFKAFMQVGGALSYTRGIVGGKAKGGKVVKVKANNKSGEFEEGKATGVYLSGLLGINLDGSANYDDRNKCEVPKPCYNIDIEARPLARLIGTANMDIFGRNYELVEATADISLRLIKNSLLCPINKEFSSIVRLSNFEVGLYFVAAFGLIEKSEQYCPFCPNWDCKKCKKKYLLESGKIEFSY
jgi:hypothetical protein